jgi:hypothetical protein
MNVIRTHTGRSLVGEWSGITIPAMVVAAQRQTGINSANSFSGDPDLAKDVNAYIEDRAGDSDWNLSDAGNAFLNDCDEQLQKYVRRDLVEISKKAEAKQLRTLAIG